MIPSKSKRNGQSLALTPDRQALIRHIVEELNHLLAEKNRVRDRIRALTSRAKAELDYSPTDFVMGVRLANMAARQDAKTLGTVREVLLALGNAVPLIAEEAEPETAPPISGKARVYNLLAAKGPATMAQLQKLDPTITSLSVHLAKLKVSGRITREYSNSGVSVWSAK